MFKCYLSLCAGREGSIAPIEILRLRRRRYLQYPHPFFPANTVRRGDASLEARPYTDFWFALRPLGVSIAQMYCFLIQGFHFSFSTIRYKQRSAGYKHVEFENFSKVHSFWLQNHQPWQNQTTFYSRKFKWWVGQSNSPSQANKLEAEKKEPLFVVYTSTKTFYLAQHYYLVLHQPSNLLPMLFKWVCIKDSFSFARGVDKILAGAGTPHKISF